VPDVYIDYILSEKFGWTDKQISETDQYKIDQYIYIIGLENQEHQKIINKRQGKQII